MHPGHWEYYVRSLMENAAVQLDLSYRLQYCFSISPISRMSLPAVSHASGAALCVSSCLPGTCGRPREECCV